MHDVADRLETALRAAGTPHRAEGEKAYLRSGLDFTGTLVSVTRAAVKRLETELGLDHHRLIALVREFFIRKAIGWVLREAGKRRPGEVVTWLEPRVHRASGVTMREAVKYLSASDRERLLTAYREGRPGS
jgi:hypothetical protein